MTVENCVVIQHALGYSALIYVLCCCSSNVLLLAAYAYERLPWHMSFAKVIVDSNAALILCLVDKDSFTLPCNLPRHPMTSPIKFKPTFCWSTEDTVDTV